MHASKTRIVCLCFKVYVKVMFKYLRVFGNWECTGGWGKGQDHRIFITNYMWIMYI